MRTMTRKLFVSRVGLTRQILPTLLALIVLATSVAGISHAVASTKGSVMFGCPGTVVVANVDCDTGVATAFDDHQPSAYHPAANQLAIDLPDHYQPADKAPWCDIRTNTTIYGCFDDTDEADPVDVGGDAKDESCQDTTATLVSDKAGQPVEVECAYEIWIDDILLQLEEARVSAQRCLALANPTPACIP